MGEKGEKNSDREAWICKILGMTEHDMIRLKDTQCGRDREVHIGRRNAADGKVTGGLRLT